MPTTDFTAYSTGNDGKSAAQSWGTAFGARGGAARSAPDEAEVRTFCARRYFELWGYRESWRRQWIELAEYISPRKGRMFITPNAGNRGSRTGHRIINATATLAARTLAAGMLTGLTSPSHRWFVLGVESQELMDQGPVRDWLDTVTDRLLTVFAKSNLYTSLNNFYEDQGVFGTGVVLIEEDHQDVIRAYVMAPGEYTLANSARLECTTLYRDFLMNVQQMVERFGYERCSRAVQALYDTGELGAEREVVHAIEPNPGAAVARASRGADCWAAGFAREYPWRSVYFEIAGDSDRLLEQSGYHELPFMAARWRVFEDDAYGRSPGMDALADVKTLQSLERRMAEGVAKMVDPPLIAPRSMQSEPITAMPGGLNFMTADAAGEIRPLYQVNFQPQLFRPLIADKEGLIKSAFFADLFLMISEMEGATPPTAEEIRVRQGEKMLMLGPVVERNQNELINPLIARTMAILGRRGLLPPAPPEIRGQRLDVTCISPLAAAQRAASTTSIEQFLATCGRLLGNPAWEPVVSAKLNIATTLDKMADALMVPNGILVSDKDAMVAVQKRAAQAQAAQQGQAALATVQGAQTLSQTDVGGGQNALAAILGNGPSPGGR